MDWLTFFATVIGSLAWPAGLVVLVLLLKEPLTGLIPLLQRLKYKDFELEFGKRVEKVKQAVEEELPGQSPLAVGDPEGAQLIRLAEIAPRAAILMAWQEVEREAVEAARRLGFSSTKKEHLWVPEAIRFLEKQENFDRKITALVRDLRSLRNQAAHARDFGPDQAAAVEYAMSTASVARYLRTLGPPRN